MAKFSDLPNELLLMTLDRLSPTDADTFCMLSKNVRAVSASFLEKHMSLKRKYTHRKYSNKRIIVRDGSLADLLRDVLRNPELGHYVRTLQIDGCKRIKAGYMDNREIMDLFRHTIQDCAMIEGHLEKRNWTADLNHGAEDPVIALLLLMLPNLTNLRLTDCVDTYCVEYMALRIGGTEDRTALARLSAIELGDPGHGLRPDYDLVLSLSSLPSIKHLSASNLRSVNQLGNELIRAQINDRDCKSEITHMSFANCLLNSTLLYSILTWSNNLSFSYCSDRSDRSRSGTYGESDYKWIRCALLAEAKDTLKDLNLYSYKEDFMGGLKDFTVLQNVSTSSRLLFGLDRKEKHTLAQMLPATTRTLRLRDTGDLGYGYHLEMLGDLAKTKADALPELAFLQYFFSTRDRLRSAKKAFEEQLEIDCKRANIRCEVSPIVQSYRVRETREVTEASGWSHYSG